MKTLLALLLSIMPALAVAESLVPADALADSEPAAAIVELAISSEGDRMPAFLYQAAGVGPHPTVVLLHGFPGNERNLDIAQDTRRAGFNVLFFNYRGAWGAEGSYSVRNLDNDALAVLGFLRENAEQYRVDADRLSVLGHSLGGYTALATGAQDAGLVCVGAMSPANMGLWKLGFEVGDETAQRLLAYADSLFMLQDFSGQAMADQIAAASITELDTRGFGRGLAGKSVFMVVGDKDTVTTADAMFTPVVEAYSKVQGLKLEQHIISGDHSFSWSRDQLSKLVLDWLQRDCR